MGGLLTIYVSSFIIALSGAMMPGPIFTTTITESLKRGPATGPRIIAGHALLEGVVVFALVMGMAPLLRKDLFFILISFAGAGILGWMGGGMLKNLPKASLKVEGEGRKRSGLLLSGVLLSLGNPYWVIWWATIGLGFMVHAQELGVWGLVAFYLGHETADFGWFSLVSSAAGKGKHLMSERVYRGIIAVSAVVLIGFAVYFSWSGIDRLVSVM